MGDQYEVSNVETTFCGDCELCKNMCDFGAHSIASYRGDAEYIVGK